MCASLLGAVAFAPRAAQAAQAGATSTAPASQRDRVSYAIGMDVAHSLEPIAPEVDIAALEAELRNAFAGNKPTLSQQDAQAVDQILRGRVAARNGVDVPPEVANAAIDKAKVGQMVGGYLVGPSLLPIKDEIELPRMMQGLRDARSRPWP